MWQQIGREAEDACTQTFELYLEEHFAVHGVVWEDGDEPPDRYMFVRNSRYAVEITTLVASIPFATDRSRPLPEVHAIYDRSVGKMEKAARNQGILDGAYSVFFARSIVGRLELERDASSFVLDFVARTRGEDTSNLCPFYSSTSPRPLGWIVKHHRKYPCICGAPPPIVESEAALSSEALRILEDRVAKKIEKMEGLVLPKVLLLLDATLLIEPEHFLASPVQMGWEESVDAAFLIRGNGEVSELWSRIAKW